MYGSSGPQPRATSRAESVKEPMEAWHVRSTSQGTLALAEEVPPREAALSPPPSRRRPGASHRSSSKVARLPRTTFQSGRGKSNTKRPKWSPQVAATQYNNIRCLAEGSSQPHHLRFRIVVNIEESRPAKAYPQNVPHLESRTNTLSTLEATATTPGEQSAIPSR